MNKEAKNKLNKWILILTFISLIGGVVGTSCVWAHNRMVSMIDDRIDHKVGYEIKLIRYMVEEHVGDSAISIARRRVGMVMDKE